MDLLNLAAKIVLDDSSYTKGVKNAEGMGRDLAQKMSAMTVAVGQLTADMVKKAVSAIGGVINGAIDGYADYQQLIGGVETLFKGSADKVAAYAKKSYQTTGLSSNQYMETVTSFSASLLQGLKGNTEAAADLANTAITDMADNANKMGSDISTIQSAYQGFAKQNYNMLDNLKLGYGGTASEMVRLINDSGILEEEIKDLDNITFDQIVQAIHNIQTEMGITGTTAKEAAETISGSKASLKAAWEDLLTAVGGGMTNDELDEKLGAFKESFSTYMDNFLPTLVSTIAGSGSLVTAIADAIGDLPADLLSRVSEAGLEAGTEMISSASKITSWLIDNITNMFKSAKNNPTQIQEFGAAIGEFLGTAISDIVTNAPDILNGIIAVGVNLAGGLIEGLFQGLFGSDSELQQINKEFNKTVTETEQQATKANAILSYMDTLVEKYGAAAKDTDEWKKAQEELNTVLSGSDSVFESYGEDVQGAIDKLKDMATELRKLAIQQAVQDKLSAQYQLLGEKTLELGESRTRQGIAEELVNGMPDTMIANARAYAKELANIGKEAGVAEEKIKEWTDLANGYVTGPMGEKVALGNLDLDTLKLTLSELGSFLQTYYDMGWADENGQFHTRNENDQIWNKSLVDNIMSPEQLAGLQTQVSAAQDTIATEIAKQAELQGEITAINDQIKTTEKAMETALNDVYSAEAEGATKINVGGDAVALALSWAATKIASVNFSTGGADGEHATGLWRVPFNGYRASLHRDEMILTKTDADAYRNNANSADLALLVGEAVEDAISHLYLNMDGTKVADMTTRRTQRNISANEQAHVRAMGG